MRAQASEAQHLHGNYERCMLDILWYDFERVCQGACGSRLHWRCLCFAVRMVQDGGANGVHILLQSLLPHAPVCTQHSSRLAIAAMQRFATHAHAVFMPSWLSSECTPLYVWAAHRANCPGRLTGHSFAPAVQHLCRSTRRKCKDRDTDIAKHTTPQSRTTCRLALHEPQADAPFLPEHLLLVRPHDALLRARLIE
jgi:hypothetical protein